MTQNFSQLIDPSYSAIGVRDSSISPGTAEYYDAKTNQGFSDPTSLAGFVNSTYNNGATAQNVFDLLKTPHAATPPVASPGLPAAPVQNAAPTVSATGIYDEEYKNAGLPDIKTRLADLDNKIAAIRAKYTGTQGTIDENPWLSEASRVGRSKTLNDEMQSEIGNYVNQQSQLKDLYDMGLNEVKLRLGLRQDDLNQVQNQQQQGLNFAAQNNISSPFFNIGGTVYRTSDLKPYSTPQAAFADGVSQDWSNVQTIQIQPDLHTQVVTAGGRSVLIDTQTGSIIKDLGGAYKTPTSGGSGGSGGSSTASKTELRVDSENQVYSFLSGVSGSDGYVSPEDWQRAKQAWMDDGYAASDFDSKFKAFINKADPQDYR
jgi:hypothetical protein